MSTVYLALSSCLGNNLRARVSNNTTFDRNYLRTFTSDNAGTWEQIEMDVMLEDSLEDEDT